LWANKSERPHRLNVGIAHFRSARIRRKPVKQRLQLTGHATADKCGGSVVSVVIVKGVQGVELNPPLELGLSHLPNLGKGFAECQG
jgi:hypothetical protein